MELFGADMAMPTREQQPSERQALAGRPQSRGTQAKRKGNIVAGRHNREYSDAASA